MNYFNRVSTKRMIGAVLACGMIAVAGTDANAGAREQAKRMHDRIAGIPPSASVLSTMETSIEDGDPLDAAELAMENSAFYNVTLKNFATPWTNEEQTVFAPLNDYTATVIGMIRDNVPFNQVLSADLLYTGNSSIPNLPAYSMNNNNHYEYLENQGIDLKDNLVAATQSALTSLPASATAGVITTRAAAQAFFIAGTNRAMFRFTLMNHLCTDLEPIKDTTRPPDRIRQDVSRSPGGDSRIFLNACVGCHSGMDPMAQAFAYYDYNETSGSIDFNGVNTIDPDTGTRVQGKYLINSDNFKYGYVTTDDHWDNYWRSGPNAALGWDATLPGSGSGAKSLGMELANSEAFATCQAKKVFKTMCLRSPVDAADRSQIDSMVTSFKANNYSMKRIFAEAAVYCMGD